jgi:hypothetical protein
MEYLLLIYGNPAEAPAEAQSQEAMQRWFTYTQELEASGAMKGGNALQLPDTATTVRVRDDETLLTDGPFAETKEIFGGWFLLEADDLDAAIEIAERIPATRMGGSVEIRALVEYAR